VPLRANKKKGLRSNPFTWSVFLWTVTAEVASSSLVVPAIFLLGRKAPSRGAVKTTVSAYDFYLSNH
jgi:hypothetical protein